MIDVHDADVDVDVVVVGGVVGAGVVVVGVEAATIRSDGPGSPPPP